MHTHMKCMLATASIKAYTISYLTLSVCLYGLLAGEKGGGV